MMRKALLDPSLERMMRCVHCNSCGIRPGAKRWSSRESPATCVLCGKLSHVIASTGSGIPAATLLIVLAFAVFGVFIGYPLLTTLCGIPSAIAYNIWAWEKAEMFPILAEASTCARRVGWLVNFMVMLGMFGP